jgi:hypothetical protein
VARKPSRAGRPLGFRLSAPVNPERVRKILRRRVIDKASFEAIGRELGISRVAVRLQYLRWKDDRWAKKHVKLPEVVSPHAAD